MIDRMINLTVVNQGGARRAEVVARADANGANETFTFTINGTVRSTTETFRAGEEKPVGVSHTEAGPAMVSVSSTPSNKLCGPCMLDLDAASSGC